AEWRSSGPSDTRFAEKSARRVGVLTVKRTSATSFHVMYKPDPSLGRDGQWRIYGALLGNGLTSDVRTGENAGRTLRHEFAVLTLTSKAMDNESNGFSAVVELPAGVGSAKAPSLSAAFWVTKDGSQKPVQAVGGDL
ncbi:MAG: hypothetical protein HY075_08815, partial [Deltaproteobacteria bacterium]|nr:hypothetical protein [Deltaproteobacteria bacterium]